MYFKSIEIENYKSFWKNQEIKLEKGFNLFIGANNSGKTTALEALDLSVSANEPHRSIHSVSEHGLRPSGVSKFKATIATNIQELGKFAGNHLYLPISTARQFNSEAEKRQYFEGFIANSQFDLLVEHSNGASNLIFSWADGVSSQASPQHNEAIYSIDTTLDEVNVPIFNGLQMYAASQSIGGYFQAYIPYVYRFSAQRQPAGISAAY